MMPRPLNWFGWSIETIAAVYETDMAAKEAEQGIVSWDYFWAAANAELLEGGFDREW
jgi:hypothetical protein